MLALVQDVLTKCSSVVKFGLGLCLPYNLVIDLALAMDLAILAIVLLNCLSSYVVDHA